MSRMVFKVGHVVKLKKGYQHPLVSDPNSALVVAGVEEDNHGRQVCTLWFLDPSKDDVQWTMDSEALEIAPMVFDLSQNVASEKAVIEDATAGGSTPKQYRRSINLPLSDSREEFVNVDIEAMDIIDEWDLSFNLGNIAKACIRLDKKDSIDDLYDLNKIIFFAIREKKKRGLITHKQFWEYVEAMK